MYAPGTAAPKVYVGARNLPQPQSSIDASRFGVPKAFMSRLIQAVVSSDPDVDGDATLNTTLSGPSSVAIAASRVATRSSASSHPIRSQPGSGSPFGRVRRTG